jgi:hypothetical protein
MLDTSRILVLISEEQGVRKAVEIKRNELSGAVDYTQTNLWVTRKTERWRAFYWVRWRLKYPKALAALAGPAVPDTNRIFVINVAIFDTILRRYHI